jgi:hypothetical protein
VIKSLYEYGTPPNSETCGTLINKLYTAIASNNFGSLTMSVVKHNHRKAVIKFACDNAEEFVAMKQYFYHYYADKFAWKGWKKLWLVK